MTRNPHLTEQDRFQIIDIMAAQIRDVVKMRLGPSALATARPGEPITLSGGEADTAARAALAALDDHPFLEVRHYSPTRDAYAAACKALEHHRKRADEAEQYAAELEAEGVDRMAERLLGECGMRALEIREGRAELEVQPARELAAIWVGVARTMLDGGENYSETPVEFEVGLAGDPERYVLIVQRVGKTTPHQARKQAEDRADQAEQRAAEAEERARHTDRELARFREKISRLHSASRTGTSLDRLRDAVTTEGGDWTVQRGFAVLGHSFSPERIRQLLNQLAVEGILIKHGKRGRLWTPVGKADDA